MARVEVDPNYSSPTFSRATAATDLFRKEDVQQLAAAFSTHVHDNAGKGLAVAAGAIPAGIITSAMIADATIQTIDLAANAVTNLQGTNTTVSFTTSSVGSYLATPLSTTITATGAPLIAFMSFSVSFTGTYYRAGLVLDGNLAAVATLATVTVPVSGGAFPVAMAWISGGLSAGVHTLGVAVNLGGAGTLAFDGATGHTIVVVEFKR